MAVCYVCNMHDVHDLVTYQGTLKLMIDELIYPFIS